MRSPRETKIITSHLEGFVDLRNHLEVLLNEINNILAIGESWLQGNEEFGIFSKINNFLGFEFSSCLNKLKDIAGKNEDSGNESHSDETEFQEAKKTILGDPVRKSVKEYLVYDKDARNVKETLQGIIDKMSTLDQAVQISKEKSSTLKAKLIKLSNKMSTKIKTLQEKLDLQDENFENKYNTRFNEIMSELHSASDFIQAKTESSSEKNTGTERKINAELNVRCTDIQSKFEDHTEGVIEKLKGYNTELQTQTKIIAEIKQEKDSFTSKITELDNKLLCITKTVENMSISHENVPYSYEKITEYDESFFYKGCHETLMSEGGETDLHELLNGCTKNPGHAGFTPFENFTIKQMPEGLCNNDLYKFVSCVADLTVRVDVKMTSPHRHVSDPFYDIRGTTNLRTGSGRVTYSKNMYSKNISHNLLSQLCVFYVYTAAQVVFDDLEASHTSIRLFYDSETSPVVSVDDVEIVNVNVGSDLCKLKCVTSDKRVIKKVFGLYTSFLDSWDSIKKTYEDSRDIHKVSFIVSHPHGCSKQISFGRWVNRYQLGLYNKFTYTTCTCPGSSGATVYCLGFEEGGENVQLVHSGSLNPKLNYSGAGVTF